MFDFFKSGWKRSVHLTDAAIFPLRQDSRPNQVFGGVRHPSMPDDFHQHRGDDGGTMLDYLASQPMPEMRLQGRGLYAGPFFKHFGHFIAESIHRLWAWHTENGAFDYIAVLPQAPNPHLRPDTPQNLPGYQRQILNYLQIPLDKLKLIYDPVIAEDLTVPLQASLLGNKSHRPQSYVDYWAEHEARFFAARAEPLPDAPEKIYVSRANYLPQGSFAGERYLETQLAAEGFFILRPESRPLVEQLHYYRQARLLVFAEGSALHTTELLGPMKADILCLQRRSESAPLWRAVLHGRSHHLAFFNMVTPLPTLEAGADGVPAPNKAISLINSPALVRYMQESGFAHLSAFDHDRFQLEEAADIARHIVHARMRNTFRLDMTTQLLKEFKKALQAHSNPYLASGF